MGDLHFFITSFILDDDEAIMKFHKELERHFRMVKPMLFSNGKGGVIPASFAMYDKDFDQGVSMEYTYMPDYVEALSGILAKDVEIVAAWQMPHGWEGHNEGSDDCQRVWLVKGKSNGSPN